MKSRQIEYPNGSEVPPDSPREYTAPAAPTHVSAPNHVAKIEKIASGYPRRRPATK